MSAQIQGKVSLQQRIDTPEFWALEPAEKKFVIDGLDPDFKSLDDSEKDYVLQGLQKTPDVSQGLNNVAGSVVKGVGDFVQSLPQAIPQTLNQAGNALKTQFQSAYDPNAFKGGRDPDAEAIMATLGGAYNATKSLAEGAYNLPGSITNAYLRRNQVAPTSFLPNAGQLPVVGPNIQASQQKNPVFNFAGEMLPYSLPFAEAARGRYLPSIAEGAGLGLTQQPEGNNQLSARLQNAAMGGAFPAALGAATRAISGKPLKAAEPQSAPAPTFQGRAVKQYGPVDRVLRGNPEQIINRSIENATTQIINLRRSGGNAQAKQLYNALPPDMQKAVMARIEAFNTKNQGRQAIKAQQVKQAAERLGPDAQNKKALAELKAAIQERYQVPPEQKTQARVEAQKQIAQNRADAQAKPIEARVKLEQARQATLQARSTREKARLEYQSAKQLLDVVKKGGDAKALANARKLVTKAQEKLTQANTVLKESKANEVRSQQTRQKAGQEGQGKQSERQDAGQKSQSQAPQKGQVKITGPGRNQRVIEQAIKEGKAIEAIHYADKAGTRSASTFERKFDLPYETGTVKRLVDPNTKRVITSEKNGKPLDPKTKAAQSMLENGQAELKDVPIVRVINENGQFSMRYLEDLQGPVKISDKAHPYAVVMDEAGKPQVVKGGQIVDQTAGDLTRHSDLKAQIEQMRTLVGDPQKASVREILEASQNMKKKDFMDSIKDLPQDKLDNLGKELGC